MPRNRTFVNLRDCLPTWFGQVEPTATQYIEPANAKVVGGEVGSLVEYVLLTPIPALLPRSPYPRLNVGRRAIISLRLDVGLVVLNQQPHHRLVPTGGRPVQHDRASVGLGHDVGLVVLGQ